MYQESIHLSLVYPILSYVIKSLLCRVTSRAQAVLCTTASLYFIILLLLLLSSSASAAACCCCGHLVCTNNADGNSSHTVCALHPQVRAGHLKGGSENLRMNDATRILHRESHTELRLISGLVFSQSFRERLVVVESGGTAVCTVVRGYRGDRELWWW